MKRCILFAGFHTASGIDDVDFRHVQKLSEVGDVYCLYDNQNTPREHIERLKNCGARLVLSRRHGEYDFGSWKRIIRELGWSHIDEYDQIILVNNSIIPLGDLQVMLEPFDRSDADFFAPCLLDEDYVGEVCSASNYLENNDPFANSVMYPSVFWVMKKALFTQDFVGAFFDRVRPQANRLDVCYKYEREFSRKILRRRIKVHLAIKNVFPTSYLYTEMAFNLVSSDFPYLKRKALSSEFYSIRVLQARVSGLSKRIHGDDADLLQGELERQASACDKIDHDWYLGVNPDVAEAGVSPEDHYLESGKSEGRSPNAQHQIYRQIQEAIQSIHQADVYEFDENWYRLQNSDVVASGRSLSEHFWSTGHTEMRDPNGKFRADRYTIEHPEVALSGLSPFQHFLATRDRRAERSKREWAAQYASCRKLAIFFNVAKDTIGGGMLSINRFASRASDMLPLTEFQVAVSGVPLGASAVMFTKFTAPIQQVELRVLAEIADPEELILLIPEVFALSFANDLTAFELSWIVSRKKLKVVILNQNHDLMPHPKNLQDAFLHMTNDVVISTAHSRYCSSSISNQYFMPIKQLTPFLPFIHKRQFKDKEKIILLSNDQIAPQFSGLQRDQIVRSLEARLPAFQFLTIDNMALDDYLDIASRAMFSITFGEGMDGYYIEPVLAGGVSFAVYNNVFFPKDFRSAPGVFDSWAALEVCLPDLINEIIASDTYDQISRSLEEKLKICYNDERSFSELRDLFSGQFDYSPDAISSHSKVTSAANNGLAEHGVSIFKVGPHQLAVTPDKLVIRHHGGHMLDALADLYVRGLYNMDFPLGQHCVFIDVGANVGLHSMYMLRNNKHVTHAYAFQSSSSAATIARHNISNNSFEELISIQQIDLGCAFKDSEEFYRPELAFSFPYTSRVEINDFSDDEDGEGEFVHLETVPASSAVMPILADNPHSLVVLRCSLPNANINLISDLLSNGVFDRLDTVIVEANSSEVPNLVDIFSGAGLQVWEHQRISGSSDKILAGSRDPIRFDNGEFIRTAGKVLK